MINKCKLNNMAMRNIRKDRVYQAIVIDLNLLGVLTDEEAEGLIGGGVPSGIKLPDPLYTAAIKKAEEKSAKNVKKSKVAVEEVSEVAADKE